MKLIAIMLMVVLTIIPVLRHKNHTVNTTAKKAHQPAKPTGEKRDASCFFRLVNVRFRLF